MNMNTVPKITKEQSTEQYITASRARELGAGNAEYTCLGASKWMTCTEDCCYLDTDVYQYKYRAIKQAQPELLKDDAAFLERFKANLLAIPKR
jgi:hypothetical protein